MRKYLWFILMLLIGSISGVKANNIIELNNKVIEFEGISGYGLQGFTATDKYLFFVLIGPDDTSSIIKVYDLENYKLVKTIEYGSLGHANDITYNPNTNRINILASGGSTLIYDFDANTFEYIETIKTSLPMRSITYLEDKDLYAVRTVTNGFVMDKEFKLTSKVPFVIGMNINTDVARQGWAYYNDYIYYANWSWIRLGGDGTNIIYVYDLKGNHIGEYLTDNKTGELEDIAFYKNKMILGFNGYDGNIKFYEVDVPDIRELLNEFNKNKVYNEDDDERNENHEDSNNYVYYILGLAIVISIIIILMIKKRSM